MQKLNNYIKLWELLQSVKKKNHVLASCALSVELPQEWEQGFPKFCILFPTLQKHALCLRRGRRFSHRVQAVCVFWVCDEIQKWQGLLFWICAGLVGLFQSFNEVPQGRSVAAILETEQISLGHTCISVSGVNKYIKYSITQNHSTLIIISEACDSFSSESIYFRAFRKV